MHLQFGLYIFYMPRAYETLHSKTTCIVIESPFVLTLKNHPLFWQVRQEFGVCLKKCMLYPTMMLDEKCLLAIDNLIDFSKHVKPFL